MQRFISIYEQMREVLNDPDTQHKEEILDSYLRVMGSYTCKEWRRNNRRHASPAERKTFSINFWTWCTSIPERAQRKLLCR